METVSANYLKSAYDAALALGANEDDLQNTIGLEVHRLKRPLARIPNTVFINLLNVASKSAKLDGIGVSIGAGFRPSTFLDVGYALTFCKNIRQVMEVNGKYQALTQRLGTTSLNSQGGATQIIWTPTNDVVAKERCVSEAVFAGYATIGRWLLWQHNHPIVSMSFRHARPSDQALEAYDTVFGCQLYFSADVDAMTIDSALIDQALPNSNPNLLNHLCTQLDSQLAALGGDRDIVHEVLHCIQAQLTAGKPSAEDVANRLAMSERSLRRRLSESRTSYSQLLQQARREACGVYMRQDGITQSQVAQLLGYTEQSAFSRAFRQWFGDAPSTHPDARW
jgi:AraC-like DNA-binding protein